MLAPETHLKGRYRILHRVGGGGFGNVYKAIDEVFGCSVAVKETRDEVAESEKMRKAFEREAKLLRNLKHECLPRVTDYFFEARAQFLVMDFIEGEDLAARLRQRVANQGPFPSGEILNWADKILSALEYLHGLPEPIIHRDIKPSNIKLGEDGGIYLLDFGLAKGATGQMSTVIEGQSSFSMAAFTHEYAPLEQLQDTGTQPQSDIYAFGATLYHLTTGVIPIAASKRDEALQRGLIDPLRPAHQVNPEMPLVVSQIISQAMAVRWWDRIGSAKEMRAALSNAAPESATIQFYSAKQSDSQSTLLQANDPGSTLPLATDRVESLTDYVAKTPSFSERVRSLVRCGRKWYIGGLSMVFVIGLGVIVRLVFPQWFTGSTKGPAITTQPQEMVRLASVTSSNLEVIRELTNHKGIVWSVAFSKDGKLAASASEDATIILWSTETWTPKFTLTGNISPVYSVAFSPDGKTLASGSREATIKLWNTENGQLIETLPRENSQLTVFRLAFSPDGNLLASCGGRQPENGGEELRLWEVHNGWKSRILEGQVKAVFAVAFSPDNKTLASVGLDKKLRFWNLTSSDGHTDLSAAQALTTIAFSEDGSYLACGSRDATIKLWLYQPQTGDWRELEPLGKHRREHKDYITSTVFSFDNRTLAVTSADGTIRLWDVANRTSKPLEVKKGGTGATQWSTTFSPDGRTLLTGGHDSVVRVWQ